MSVLLNKSDLLSPTELEELVAWYKENCRAEQVRCRHRPYWRLLDVYFSKAICAWKLTKSGDYLRRKHMLLLFVQFHLTSVW